MQIVAIVPETPTVAPDAGARERNTTRWIDVYEFSRAALLLGGVLLLLGARISYLHFFLK